MTGEPESTARRRYIGRYIHGLRDAKRLTLDTAGRLVERSASSLSMIENARQSIRPRDLEHILRRYDLPIESVDGRSLLELARQDGQTGWWKSFRGIATPLALEICSLEYSAGRLRQAAQYGIPGLLQTEAYANSMINHPYVLSHDKGTEQAFVDFRMARQRLLCGDTPPEFHFIVHEDSLRSPRVGRQVMRAQLAKLIEASEYPHTTIQVCRTTSRTVFGLNFTVLDLVNTNVTLILVEHLFGRWILEDELEITRYGEVFDQASALLPTPEASRDLIHHIASAL